MSNDKSQAKKNQVRGLVSFIALQSDLERIMNHSNFSVKGLGV